MSMVRATKALQCLAQSLLIGAALLYGPRPALAQTQQEQSPDGAVAPSTQEHEPSTKPEATNVPPTPPVFPRDNSKGKQPKRILWIIANYSYVSANTQLPPRALKDKLWLVTQDSFHSPPF